MAHKLTTKFARAVANTAPWCLIVAKNELLVLPNSVVLTGLGIGVRKKMKNRLDTDGLAVMMFLVVTVTLVFLERLS